MPLTQVSSRLIEDTLRYVLGASGTDHYTFTGKGLTGAVNDPTLTLSRGHTYVFENRNSANAHPFYIKTSIANGGTNDQYSTGVTNNGGAGGTEIVFTVPHDAPDLLYYQCSSHINMAGQLKIAGAVADGSITTAKLADEAVTLAKLPHGTSSNDGKFLRANNGADPSFETVTGTTINNNADNRVITGSGTANTLEGESNLTFTGSILTVTNSSGASELTLVTPNNTDGGVYFNDGTNSGAVTYQHSDDSMRFRVNAAEKMRIDSSGNVGIGVTDIKAALQVNSDKNAETDRHDGSNYHLFLRNPADDSGEACGLAFAVTSNATKTGAAIMFEREGGGSQGSLQFYTNGDGNSVTERMRIESDGDLRVQRIYDNTTSGGANVRVQSNGLLQRDTSSRRYKNTITDATHGLADLNKLRSVTYKGNNDGDTIFGGLIAEEVHDAGLTEFVDYDSDNQPDALKYGNMVSLCIKAIQELSAKVETLKTKVAALEAG